MEKEYDINSMDEERDINPRYLAYCKFHKLSIKEMREYDDKKYPGGHMLGFMLWIQEKWKEWEKTKNLPFKIEHYSTNMHKEFDEWLEGKKVKVVYDDSEHALDIDCGYPIGRILNIFGSAYFIRGKKKGKN